MPISRKILSTYPPGTWYCPECGSTELQGTAWVWLNDGAGHKADENTNDEPPSDAVYCTECEDEIRPELTK